MLTSAKLEGFVQAAIETIMVSTWSHKVQSLKYKINIDLAIIIAIARCLNCEFSNLYVRRYGVTQNRVDRHNHFINKYYLL